MQSVSKEFIRMTSVPPVSPLPGGPSSSFPPPTPPTGRDGKLKKKPLPTTKGYNEPLPIADTGGTYGPDGKMRPRPGQGDKLDQIA